MFLSARSKARALSLLKRRFNLAHQASPVSDLAFKVEWSPPLNNGGAELLAYKVEWDGHGGPQETQVVQIIGHDADGNATTAPLALPSQYRVAGTFRLSFDGATTTVLPADCSAQQMMNALNALPTIGEVAVARSGPADSVAGSATFGGRYVQNSAVLIA